MADSPIQKHVNSAVSSLSLIWDNAAPDHGDPAVQTAWALAAVAQTQAAMALALEDIANAIRFK